MMNIEKLLDYQAIDAELIKLEHDFRALPIYKEYNHSVNSFKDAQAAVKRLNSEADDMHKQMQSLIEQYKKQNDLIADAESEIAEIKDIKQADFYARNMEKTLQELQQLSKGISELSSRIEEHRKTYDKAIRQGKEAKQKGTEAKPLYDGALNDIKPQIDGLKKKMSALEKVIEEKAINHYKQLRGAKKLPAVVPLHGEASCGGCFMELAGNSTAILKSEGYIECPNCSRMIYIK